MNRLFVSALALASVASLQPSGQAIADSCARDAMLVFDGSASMAEPGSGSHGRTRLIDAQEAMGQLVPEVASLRRIGLLIYGPGPENSCDGLNLKFAPMPDAADPILDQIEQIVPSGLTPLTASVQAAADVLEYKTRPGIIVLVTDGSETCGGEPCALGSDLSVEGLNLTVHVIGFRLVFDPFSWNGVADFNASKDRLRCLAEVTGGQFVETETVGELSGALRETLGCALVG